MPTNNGNPVLDNTIQSQVKDDEFGGLDVMPLLIRAGQIVPPYWSRARDWELGRFWMPIDHVASALSMFVAKTASIPVEIRPRDTSFKSHIREADYLNAILVDGSDFGQGWHVSLASKMIMSLLTQDNGVFVEVIGDGPKDGERQGPVLGFASLDPQRCQRTSNPIYPVLYQDVDGTRYKLHHSRVMYSSSLPSTNVRLNGVGFCALSRMLNTAQHLNDLATAEQEELGSRPKRQMIIGRKGVTMQELIAAFTAADIEMDNQNLARYSKSVVIAPKDKRTVNTEIDIEVKDLKSAIIGEDKERSITLGMFLIALALNIPPRWLWPATSTGATKADAMFQHIAGMGGGIGYLLMMFRQMLGGSPLSDVLKRPIPSRFEIVFDFQDDEQDRQRAEIHKLRSENREKDLTTGVIDLRTAREQALNDGDITDGQFEQMELESGRLMDGSDILNLFMTADPELQQMLALSVGDVLNVEANDAAFVLSRIAEKLIELRVVLSNPARPKTFQKARQAMFALEALRKLYEETDKRAAPEPPPPPEMVTEAQGTEVQPVGDEANVI